MIPDGAFPNPHALLVVQNRRVLVTTHGKTTADHGVAELHRIQVERQNLTDVETQTSLHDEAAEMIILLSLVTTAVAPERPSENGLPFSCACLTIIGISNGP